MKNLIAEILGRGNRKIRSKSSHGGLGYDRLRDRILLTTFVVDAVNGNDANPGTAELPLASFNPLVWAYGQSDPNIGRIELRAGDEVLVRPGTYTATFQNPEDVNTGTYRGLYFRGLNGTAENPIVFRAEPGVVINPTPADNSEGVSVQIEQSQHVEFSGFEITGLGTGLFVATSSNIDIFDNWFHDIEGAAIDNLSAIMLTANDGEISVYENLFHDVFDENNGASENARFIAAFGNEGADVRIFNNTLFNSVPTDHEYSSGGIITKHGSDSRFYVGYNVFDQVRNESIGTSNPNSLIEHNLIYRSNGIAVRDFGGPAFFNDIAVANNTFVQADDALVYNPSDAWYPTEAFEDIGAFTFEDNLVQDIGFQAIDQGTIAIGLGPDTTAALAEKILADGNLEFDGNIYSHTTGEFTSVLFSYLENYQQGHSFEDWQNSGFDLNGLELDFELDQLFRPQDSTSTAAGWYAGEASRLTVFAVDDDGEVVVAPQISEGQSQTFSLVRSGDDLTRLNQPLTVVLSSNSDHFELPKSVTFQPGQTQLQIQATATNDGSAIAERAVRISAEAVGTENNVDAWVRVVDSGSDPNTNPGPVATPVPVPDTDPAPDVNSDPNPGDAIDSFSNGTVVLNEDFEDGVVDAPFVPPNDRFSRIVEAEGGNNVFEITYEQDEFDRKIEWIGEPFDSIEVSYQTRIPDGIDTSQNSRHFAELKQFRVFEGSGNLGEVFTTVIQKYDAQFVENLGVDRWEVLHLFSNDVEPIRIPLDSPTEWLDLRYFMQWNSPGNSDGVLMIWHDNQLVYENQAVSWFDNETLRPDGFWIGGNYSGGQEGQPVPTTRRQIDNAFAAINGEAPVIGNSNPSDGEPEVPQPEPEVPQSDPSEPESPTPMVPETEVPVDNFDAGILSVPSTPDETVEIEFDFTQRQAEFDNEFGLAIVQADGSIAGVSPSDLGYAQQVLESGTTLFSKGAVAGESSTVQVPGGSRIIFYLIQNASKSELLAANSQNALNSGPVVFFSNIEANPDQFDHVAITSAETNQFRLGWEDLVNGGDQSFTDGVIDIRINELSIADTPNQEPEPSGPSEELPAPADNSLHNSLQPGDVDQDGEVTLRDVVFVAFAFYDPEFRSSRLALADVNNDGIVDFDDIFNVFDIWANR